MAAPVELLGIPLEDNDEIMARDSEKRINMSKEEPEANAWNRDFSFSLTPQQFGN